MAERPYIGKWISVLYRCRQAYFDKCFAEYGIGNRHHIYLLYLYRDEGVTQDVMSRYFYVDKATAARSILHLESLGYVYREVDSRDKRAYKVFLTDKGRALEPKIREVLHDWAVLLTKNFTDDERELAYHLLQWMADNALAAKEADFVSQ